MCVFLLIMWNKLYDDMIIIIILSLLLLLLLLLLTPWERG